MKPSRLLVLLAVAALAFGLVGLSLEIAGASAETILANVARQERNAALSPANDMQGGRPFSGTGTPSTNVSKQSSHSNSAMMPGFWPDEKQPPWVKGSRTASSFASLDGVQAAPDVGAFAMRAYAPQAVLPGFTVDLAHDAVMGRIQPGDRVTVAVGTSYGAAVADATGFFWTPLWQAGGAALDLIGGETVEIAVNDVVADTVVVQAVSGGIDVLADQVGGNLSGLGDGIAVTVTLGGWGQLPAAGAAFATGTTDLSGDFSIFFDEIDLTPGELAQVDYRASAHVHVRAYLRADPWVFAVVNNNRAVGYVAPYDHVQVTAYSSYPSDVIWQAEADADLLGYYNVLGDWDAVPAGSVFEVVVNGSAVSTTVADLHDITFDAGLDSVSGTAPAGSDVLVYFYGWQDDHSVYTQTQVTANGSGAFSADLAADLLARHDVVVFVHDAAGNGTAIFGGPAYIHATVSSNGGCVTGRVDAPGQPVEVSLQTGAGIYTRTASTWPTDAGNWLLPPGLCYSIRGDDWGPLPFEVGDILHVQSPSWSGSLAIPALAWQPDTLGEQIAGEAPAGLLRVDVSRWYGEQYPDDGRASRLVVVDAGSFSADFAAFDLRDADRPVFYHYNAADGFGVEWPDQTPVHYFNVFAPWGMYGEVNTPNETVIARLYDEAGNLLASPGTVADSQEFWIGDFQGQVFAPGYWITVTGSSGWEAGFQIPDLSVAIDENADRIEGRGPQDRLFVETNWEFTRFLPSQGAAASPSFLLDAGAYGHDVQYGDFAGVFYTAPIGDRFWSSKRWPYIVAHYGYGVEDNHVWGNGADPHAALPLTVTTSGGAMLAAATVQANSVGEFDTTELPAGVVAPGNVVLVDFGGAVESMTVMAIGGVADPGTEIVTITAPPGALIHMNADGPNGWWESGWSYPDGLVVGPGGTISFDLGMDGYDIVPGTSFNVHSTQDHGHNTQYSFWLPVLHLRTNYTHDWIEGSYDGGHTLWITLTDSTGATKATASGETGPVSWWGGTVGFSTNYNIDWDGPQPDIQPGDWVYASTDDGLSAVSRLGTIRSSVNLGTDLVAGTIDAPWYTSQMPGDCGIWENNGAGMSFRFNPNGGAFSCNFAGRWDIIAGNMIGVSYTEPDGDQVISIVDNPAPFLRIWSWISGDLASGSNASFSIGYRNEGNLATQNAIISATLENGLTYLGDTSGLTLLGGTGAPGDPLIWQLGALPPDGQDRYFFLFAAVTASAGQNVALVTQIDNGSPYDQSDDPGAKRYRLVVPVNENDTELTIGKSTWTWDPVPGTEFVYDVQVCNNGSTASADMIVTDTLPLSTTLVAWWGQQAGWEEISSSAHELVVSRPSAVANQCYSVYVQVALDAGAEAGMQLHNTASVYARNDIILDNNFAELWHNVGLPHANLSVYKNWNWGSLTPGGQIRYNINYQNNGNLPASGVRLTDTLPVSTTFVAAYWYDDAGPHALPPDVDTNGQVAWDVGDLGVGHSGNFEIVLAVDEDAIPGTPLTNTATITRLPAEDRLDDNTSTVIETLYDHGPNLRVSQEGNWHGYGEGHDAWFHLIVENVGDVAVDFATLTDTLPAGMEIEPSPGGNNPDTDWGSVEAYEHGTDWFRFTFRDLHPNWRRDVYVNTQIPGPEPIAAGLAYTNHAEFEMLAGESLYDDNVSDYALFTGPNLYVRKSLQSGDVQPGEVVTYALFFGNDQAGHTSWWNMQGNVLLTDTLPAGAEFITSTLRWCDGTFWCSTDVDVQDGQLRWQFGPMNGDNWNEIYVTIRLTDTLTEADTVVNRVQIGSDQPGKDLEVDYTDNEAVSVLPVVFPHFDVYLPLIIRNH
ncbi:MAG: hypothetical protein ACOYYS_21310 [Chloroflexota bacterium]